MMKPVPILLMTEATAGGTRRHLFDLVTGLDRNMFAPSILCSTLRDPAFQTDIERFKELNIPVRIVTMHRDPFHPWRDMAALAAIRRHLDAEPCRILHTHSSKAGFLGRLAARQSARTLRVIHTPHVFPFRMRAPLPLGLLYERLEKTAARWTDQFICVCEEERFDALRRRLAEPDKFTVIRNGIDQPVATAPDTDAETERARARFGYRPQDIVIGSVGRFAIQKGFDVLLQAARILAPRLPNMHLFLAGEGPEQRRIETLARRLGLQSKLRILPPPANPDEIHRLLDIFVLPSLWEGLPYGLLEAMAARKAIAASRTGGVPEAIADNENGLLTPPGHAEALADALNRLAQDPALRKRLGKHAAETVAEKFRLDAMIAKTEQIYDKWIDNPPA